MNYKKGIGLFQVAFLVEDVLKHQTKDRPFPFNTFY